MLSTVGKKIYLKNILGGLKKILLGLLKPDMNYVEMTMVTAFISLLTIT
jgi:hypothetical protein